MAGKLKYGAMGADRPALNALITARSAEALGR